MNLNSLIFLLTYQPFISVKSLESVEQQFQKLKELAVMKADWDQKRISQSRYVSPILLTCLSLIETNNQLIIRGLQQQKRAAQLGMPLIHKAQQLSIEPSPIIQTNVKRSFKYLRLYEECLRQKDITFYQEMYLPQVERQNKWLQRQIQETELCIRREQFLLNMYDSLRETREKRQETQRPLKSKLMKLQKQAEKLAAQNQRLQQNSSSVSKNLS